MNLETKRNALMNAVASGQLTNLLANTTWQSGYFAYNGSISGSGVPKEMYESEYIDLDSSETYVLLISTPNLSENWIGIGTYNNDGTWKSRLNTSDVKTTSYRFNNQSKIRVSFRTYGNSYALLCTQTEYENFITSNGIYVGD